MKFLRPMLLICAIMAYTPAVMAADTGASTGTVAETIASGGYVYLRLEEQGIWIAANSFAVSRGDMIQYSGGTEMKGFYSKTLDRTFESVFFVQSANLVSGDTVVKKDASAGHAGTGMQMPKRASVQAPEPGQITALKDGKTVADVFAGSSQLKEQTVSLNAKVMKISKKIMGKNWITLQDGSGTAPDNKLLATSQEVVSPGDMVIARGIVRTDIDLGSGYKYKVLLEETTFSPGFE